MQVQKSDSRHKKRSKCIKILENFERMKLTYCLSTMLKLVNYKNAI